MGSSYRTVNYSTRLSKAIERRMICDAVKRMYPFERIENYRYVGMGSIYFSDFVMMHRQLGITKMVSVERNTYEKAAFENNLPHNCIELHFKPTGNVLPELPWDDRSVVWLDYDGRLDESVLSDIGTVCANARSGSLLIVTVNAQPEPELGDEARQRFEEAHQIPYTLADYRLKQLEEALGELVPPETDGKGLRKDGLALISRKLIVAKVFDCLAVRNLALGEEVKLKFRQIFNFHYKDNALMLTVGGIIHEASEQAQMNNCAFEDLDFVRDGQVPFSIEAPCLTLKEIRDLNAQLPKTDKLPVIPGVSEKEIQKFVKLYRYYPVFTEALVV